MQIALIGFHKSGKTAVFNALTGANADVSAFSLGRAKTHRATVTVPDDRLDRLHALLHPKKIVHASIDYLDPIGIRRDQVGHGSGLGDEMLDAIGTADALAVVVRAFEDEGEGECDPEGDYEAIALELLLSDLAKVDNRLGRVAVQAQRVGGGDRAHLEAEMHLMQRLKEGLEAGRPVRDLNLTADESRTLRSFQFLTAKPLIVLVNTGENANSAQDLLARLRERSAKAAGGDTGGSAASSATAAFRSAAHFMALNGRTEMEIAQLAPEERADFLAAYGIDEPGAVRMTRLSYEALGVISFFTVAHNEGHAWTIHRGTPVVEAAGTVHSDMQRGFIRAQVIRWDALLEAGSVAEARKRGTLKIEGKDYIVQDGDVIEIMFSA